MVDVSLLVRPGSGKELNISFRLLEMKNPFEDPGKSGVSIVDFLNRTVLLGFKWESVII